MKIAYVIDYLNSLRGGTERQLYKLIEGMVSRGHEVELYVFRETNFTRSLSAFPCPVYCLGVGSILSFAALRKLWHFRQSMIARNFEVVHGFFIDVALVMPPLMMATKIKTYTSRRDMGIWYTASKLVILRLFRFAGTKLICNSHAVARLTQEREWKTRAAIQVIHNGIERYTDAQASAACDWAPKKVGESGDINVVLVANVRPVKRIEDLIIAASRLNNGQYQIHYYIVGALSQQKYYETLQVIIRRYQLEDYFHFVGPVTEPRCGLDRFDIGVLTSASEGLSNTIMEYLDVGLPVVVSSVGGNPELVVDGHNGFLYEAGDYEGLAACLHKLVSDIGLRGAFAANTKDAMREFNLDTMVERYEKIYAQW